MRMKVDLWRNMLWQNDESILMQEASDSSSQQSKAHSSSSCFHLRCTGDAKLEFYRNYANSHASVLHHGHMRAHPSGCSHNGAALPDWWIRPRIHLDHLTSINLVALLPHISQDSLICLALLFTSKPSLVTQKNLEDYISMSASSVQIINFFMFQLNVNFCHTNKIQFGLHGNI